MVWFSSVSLQVVRARLIRRSLLRAFSTLRGMKIVERRERGDGVFYTLKRADDTALNLLDVKLDFTDRVTSQLTLPWRDCNP